MTLVEQQSTAKFVVLDKIKEKYETSRQILLTKGDIFTGQILDIGPNQNFDGTSIRFQQMVSEDKKTDITATWSLPTYLHGELGLNPDWPRQRTAIIGDIVEITYLGRDETKEGNPYMFKVAFSDKKNKLS